MLRSFLAALDWPLLYALARRHATVAQLYHTLSAQGLIGMAGEWQDGLRGQALAHGKRNLLSSRELVRLLALLESNGIPALAFKGPALAVAAYGDLALRQYGDLDILVHPQNVERATLLLLGDCYFTDGSVFATERPFGRRDGWVVVDLHWGLTVPHLAGLLDEAGMWRRAQRIPLAGGEVCTLAPEDHLLVLAVHGFKDGWSRLKWVCDVAGLVERYPSFDWDAIERRADGRGMGRALRVALALAHRLLGTALPPALCQEIEGDRQVAALTARLIAAMQQEEEQSVAAQAWEEFSVQWRTLTRAKDRAAYALYRLSLLATPTAEDRARLPLPVGLTALHYLTRPLRLAWSYGLPWLWS